MKENIAGKWDGFTKVILLEPVEVDFLDPNRQKLNRLQRDDCFVAFGHNSNQGFLINIHGDNNTQMPAKTVNYFDK